MCENAGYTTARDCAMTARRIYSSDTNNEGNMPYSLTELPFPKKLHLISAYLYFGTIIEIFYQLYFEAKNHSDYFKKL
jgi:hypothetical protein